MAIQTIEVWDNANRNAGEYRSVPQPPPANLVSITIRCGLDEADRGDTAFEIGFGLEGLYDGVWQPLATTTDGAGRDWIGGISLRTGLPKSNPQLAYESDGGWPTQIQGWIKLYRRTRLDLFVDLETAA